MITRAIPIIGYLAAGSVTLVVQGLNGRLSLRDARRLFQSELGDRVLPDRLGGADSNATQML
jgi:hypothetical protein